MDSKTPYLDAIQKIPGNTAKEKYKSLNKIIKETVESKKAPGDFALQTSYGSPIPQSLTPLIQVEIGKILKNADDVIAALKSDDVTVMNRALQAKWMFDGSNKSVTNFQYFETHILPEVSLNTRSSIIRRLSQYLGSKNEYLVAQEFFDGLLKSYGLHKALPLLTACSENYISKFIKDGNVYLPKKIVVRLFPKYPELVIRYLKFCKPNSRKQRVVDSIPIDDYLDLLPHLIREHVNDFIDLVNSFDNPLKITLGTKSTEVFLKDKGIEALIAFPQKYLPMLSLQFVTNNLNKEQFKLMFRNLFPKNQKQFSFSKVLSYLEFQPEKLKLPLITKTFRDLYGVDLITLLDKVTPELMLLLPEKDRIDLAQKKLAEDPNFNLNNCEESWVCYLSTKDSILQIKDQIAKTKLMDERAELIQQLIYTCKVNKSEEDLLLVLKYISTRHRNEISIFWFAVYESLLKYFDMEKLSVDHWEVLNEMIKRSHVKDHLSGRSITSEKLLEKNIHFNILNNIPIENEMTLLSELKIKGWNSEFNILIDNPELEKRCLEAFIYIIPRKFPEDDKIWKDNKVDTILYLTKGLYNYNQRITEAAKKRNLILRSGKLLSLSNYPWLLEQVKTIVVQENQKRQYKIDALKILIQKNEQLLYESLFPKCLNEKVSACVYKQEGLNLLKKEPGKILENWKDYLESCEETINCSYTKRFIKKCIWYKEIPVKFAQECLKKVDEPDRSTLMILALLLQGPEFSRIIEPLIPESEKIIIDGEDAKKLFFVINSIPSAISLVNPPPPFELVGKFCKGDFMASGLVCLTNVSRRTSVNKVIAFAKSLVDKPVSIKKHGIRLMYTVAPISDLCEFLGHLWKSEKHKSIREVIFKKAFSLFVNEASKETWLLMSFCIEDLTNEDIECLQLLVEIRIVPNEYIKDYFTAGLIKVEKLAETRTIFNQLICRFLQNATPEVCAFFPEDYCRLLVQKFAFDFNIDENVSTAGRLYTVNSFLIESEEKLESRLKYFCNLLSTAISKHWDEPDPNNFKAYPMKQCFCKIISDIVGTEIRMKIDPRIPEAMFNLFSSVLQPVQDSKSYLYLFFVIELRKAEFDGRLFGLMIAKQIPKLLGTFTCEMILEIGEMLLNFVSLYLHSNSEKEIFIGPLIEALVDFKLIHSAIIAAIILYDNHKLIPDRQYKDIVEKLGKIDHPAVVSILNRHFVTQKNTLFGYGYSPYSHWQDQIFNKRAKNVNTKKF